MTRVIIPCRYELAQQICAEHSLPRRHPWRVFLILLLPPHSKEVWHGPVFWRVASALPETATTWCAVTNATLLDPATYTNDFRGQRSLFLLGRSIRNHLLIMAGSGRQQQQPGGQRLQLGKRKQDSRGQRQTLHENHHFHDFWYHCCSGLLAMPAV